jgi:hypothetical protein
VNSALDIIVDEQDSLLSTCAKVRPLCKFIVASGDG